MMARFSSRPLWISWIPLGNIDSSALGQTPILKNKEAVKIVRRESCRGGKSWSKHWPTTHICEGFMKVGLQLGRNHKPLVMFHQRLGDQGQPYP